MLSTHCNVTSNILSAMDVTHNDIHFQSHQFILTYILVNNSALAFTIFLKHKCFLKTDNFFPSKETSDSCNYYKGNYCFEIQVLICATQRWIFSAWTYCPLFWWFSHKIRNLRSLSMETFSSPDHLHIPP